MKSTQARPDLHVNGEKTSVGFSDVEHDTELHDEEDYEEPPPSPPPRRASLVALKADVNSMPAQLGRLSWLEPDTDTLDVEVLQSEDRLEKTVVDQRVRKAVTYGGVGPGMMLRKTTYKDLRGPTGNELTDRLKELEEVKKTSPASFGEGLTKQMEILQDSETVWNWAQTYSCKRNQFVVVHSEDEVIFHVKENSKVRCSGAMHSSSPLSASEGVIISTKGLDRVLYIDAEEMTCTCEAGVVVGVLIAHLHLKGYALPQMGTIDHQVRPSRIGSGGECGWNAGCRFADK